MPSPERIEERYSQLSVTRSFRRINKLKAPDEDFRRAAKVGAIKYRSFLTERFLKYSRKGGRWKNLKPATIRAKERIGSRTPTLKLRRFGPLLTSLSPIFSGLPGQLEVDTADGIEVGIGGSGSYPSGITIGEVAAFHQAGLGRLPQRTIVVFPPSDVLGDIANDVKRELLR